ncbi:hypothetical protein EVAR_12160_1 [Eumeta japonica]|uniref:Uncharacterized protein n=1 Tax=Eumeta variegata TaxID=151549 RepID=A0A4C1UI81_EUMVA|nr:hypothetical protein EVAR_12160_1 [Eumeta japonica]
MPFLRRESETNHKNYKLEQSVDRSLWAVTNHVRTNVGNNVREVLASSDHRKLPADVLNILQVDLDPEREAYNAE